MKSNVDVKTKTNKNWRRNIRSKNPKRKWKEEKVAWIRKLMNT